MTQSLFDEGFEDDLDIHEAYDLLFKESLKLKKINRFVFKKLNDLELKKERFVAKFEDSTRSVNELKVEKESFEIKVKTLTSDLEKSNIQFFSFSSGFEKIDNIMQMLI